MIRAALFSVLLAASMLAASATPAAADSSFSGVVNGCTLIVLADVAVRSDGGITLNVEQVLKGHAGETLRFPPSTSAVEPGWARAVVAFTDPSTIARGVTFAWHVGESGALDPERLEQFPGTPQTLDAMLTWFGLLPATNAVPAAGDSRAPDWRLATLAVAGLAAIAGAVSYRRRNR